MPMVMLGGGKVIQENLTFVQIKDMGLRLLGKNEEMTAWYASDEQTASLAAIIARSWWRDVYRRCRELGDRELAFRVVGKRRKISDDEEPENA